MTEYHIWFMVLLMRGGPSEIFSVIPRFPPIKKDAEQKNREAFLEELHRDCLRNFNRGIAKISEFPKPVIGNRNRKGFHRTIATFRCSGARFGLENKEVVVRVFDNGITEWAEIFYANEKEGPVCVIERLDFHFPLSAEYVVEQ